MDSKVSDETLAERPASKNLHCGLVMPISGSAEYSAEHWSEVRAIITEAVRSISDPNFDVAMVSESEDVGVIHKKIVQNLYNAYIVICDVSAKNPNVMLELGMRLAFDKPTVIVKDDKTDYSFDTSVIEHIGYPRDLRFGRMVAFKQTLAAKVLGTFNQARLDPTHSTFLKNFGQFKVATLEQTEVTADRAILDAIADLQSEVTAIRVNQRRTSIRERYLVTPDKDMYTKVFRGIEEFRVNHPTGPIEETNPDLMEFLARQLDARSTFKDQQSFHEFVRPALVTYQNNQKSA